MSMISLWRLLKKGWEKEMSSIATLAHNIVKSIGVKKPNTIFIEMKASRFFLCSSTTKKEIFVGTPIYNVLLLAYYYERPRFFKDILMGIWWMESKFCARVDSSFLVKKEGSFFICVRSWMIETWATWRFETHTYATLRAGLKKFVWGVWNIKGLEQQFNKPAWAFLMRTDVNANVNRKEPH